MWQDLKGNKLMKLYIVRRYSTVNNGRKELLKDKGRNYVHIKTCEGSLLELIKLYRLVK